MSNSAHINALATALPRYEMAQDAVRDMMCALHDDDERVRRQLRSIYRRSQIRRRFTCCSELLVGGEGFVALGAESTAARMGTYEREAGPLALRAAQRALDQAPFATADYTHLIFATCTGFCAPGPEHYLVSALGLSPSVQRLQIGFMGCQAGLRALQAASAICRSDADAVVLVVCAELCSLHFHHNNAAADLVVNSLFGDGAAAAVLSASCAGRCRLLNFASHLLPDSAEAVSWRIGDAGFDMGLDLVVPEMLRQHLADFVATLCNDLSNPPQHWAVHPGGRAVLDAVERALKLRPEQMAASRRVLANYGNMSSPSVLFVLEDLLQSGASGCGAMLAFGPGLSMEGAIWEVGDD